jgi:SAM-dependent MidA family methyltransferase
LPEAATAPATLGTRLARMIAATGPITVARYMAEANAHYYAGRDPLGRRGDFVTAPEISQMFGELVGLWFADLWQRSGAPSDAHFVELGPGRGTLAADATRAMARAGLEPSIELVEASPSLRAAQAERVPAARWHDSLDSLPADGPLLIAANEFFDALPVRQLVATPEGWRERMVAVDGDRFVPVAGPLLGSGPIPAQLRDAAPGTILEACPAAAAIMRGLADRIAAQGGAVLVIDYGHAATRHGETLQAVASHALADRWANPGEQDLSAHVDFEALAQAAGRPGIRIAGPVEQGSWLLALGIDVRAAALARTAPSQAAAIEAARARLTEPEAMGSLFKVMAVAAAGWAEPAGFA